MSTFAYSVAIRLTVANLASQGVRLLAKDLLAAHGRAVNLGDKLKALRTMAIGYGLEKTGSAMVGFLGKAVDASKEYTSQLSLMNAAGMSQMEIAKATAAAWQTSRDVITTTAADNLKAIRELRSVFGDRHMGEAYKILPAVARTSSILEALTGKAQENVAFDMVKSAELRAPGVMTSALLQRNADLMARTLMAMGGTLNVADFHSTLKQGKTASLRWSDDFVYNYLPTFMQEAKTGHGGAQAAGTALMTTYAAIIGGTLKKSSLPLWESMGLIRPSDVVKNSTGAMQLKPGAVQGAALFQNNPYLWATQVLAPAIATYGAAHGMNREQVVAGLFGNRNAQWTMNTFMAKAAQFDRDKQTIGQGSGSYQTYQKLLKSNPQLAEQAMHAQWQNVLSIIGYQILPKLIPWMIKFANVLGSIAQWAQANQAPFRIMVFGFGALGIALAGIGKAMMFVGLVRFLGIGSTLLRLGLMATGAVTGVTLLALAAYELWVHWDSIAPKLKGLWSAITSGVAGMINTVIGWMNHIPGVHISPIGAPSAAPNVVHTSHMSGNRQGDVYIDGKLAGKILTPHLLSNAAKQAGRPNQGTSGFNPGWSVMRPATGR